MTTSNKSNIIYQVIEMMGYIVTSLILKVFNKIVQSITHIGYIISLLGKIFYRIPLVYKNPSIALNQAMDIAIYAIPLIFVTAFFTGAVTAESAAYQFRNFIPLKYIGTAVTISVILEVGPVLTGLVLAGRTSSAIAAEIGSMKEKEELDAMKILNLDPLRYLAMPRLLTCIIMFPILSIIASFLAIVGGWVDAVTVLDMTTSTYVFGARFLFEPYFIVVNLVKAFSFGVIVSLIGYYYGITAGAGAKGVGRATMRAVVTSCVLILIFDFIISYIMLRGMIS